MAAAALFASALVMLMVWIVYPDQVDSNGGQIFFIMLWTLLGYVATRGGGWVRYAIAAVFVVALWGLVNTAAPLESIAGHTPAEILCRALQAGALVLLYLPQSHRWFQAVATSNGDD